MFNTIYSGIYKEFYPFSDLGKIRKVLSRGDKINDANAMLILHGGEDISPINYQEEYAHPKTTAKPTQLTDRDKHEIGWAKEAIAKGIPIMAICRGAQLMCCLAGGKLIQHVNNHNAMQHAVDTYNNKRFRTNTIHHQMMYPWYTDHDLLAWTQGISTVFENGKQEEWHFPEHAYLNSHQNDPLEPEIVWFPKIKTLAVQGHPEWAQNYPQFQQFVIDEFLARV